MARERTTRGKVMRPNYFVFCEGDTEVRYVEMLRAQFRCPIHIPSTGVYKLIEMLREAIRG